MRRDKKPMIIRGEAGVGINIGELNPNMTGKGEVSMIAVVLFKSLLHSSCCVRAPQLFDEVVLPPHPSENFISLQNYPLLL